MFARANSHGQYVCLNHFVDKLLADIGAVRFLLLCFWLDDLINKLPCGLLQLPMALGVVGAVELGREPRWFSVRHLTEISWVLVDDFRLLALDGAYAEAGADSLEDFMAMEIVECACRILSGYLLQYNVAPGMRIDIVRQVVDFMIDNNPQGILSVVLLDLLTSECPQLRGLGFLWRHGE